MKEVLFKGSAFCAGDGITYGLDIQECEYDCFVTLKRKKDGMTKNLSKMWKRELKDGNRWPDGVPIPDLSDVLCKYAKKLTMWGGEKDAKKKTCL